ncbi:MAG: DUF5946 family protein [Candidatus Promineifilaceae bacterium]
MPTEICPDCGVELPQSTGAHHPYIGASASCWTLYANNFLAGQPIVTDTAYGITIHDAYCVQHHGLSADKRAVQSVAVHLVTLYAVLKLGQTNTYWVRNRLLRGNRHNRFTWLTPPETNKQVTILPIVEAQSLHEQTKRLEHYVKSIADNWLPLHEETVVHWYEKFVLADRI